MDTFKNILIGIITGGLGVAFIGQLQATRLRRKELIAEAYQTTLARLELLYRISRRSADKTLAEQDAISIRDEMHDIQTKTDYYIGLLRTESIWFGKAYQSFVVEIKKITAPLMQQAWDSQAKGPGAKLENEKHPDISQCTDKFLADVRDFFNPFSRLKRRWQYYKTNRRDNGRY